MLAWTLFVIACCFIFLLWPEGKKEEEVEVEDPYDEDGIFEIPVNSRSWDWNINEYTDNESRALRSGVKDKEVGWLTDGGNALFSTVREGLMEIPHVAIHTLPDEFRNDDGEVTASSVQRALSLKGYGKVDAVKWPDYVGAIFTP